MLRYVNQKSNHGALRAGGRGFFFIVLYIMKLPRGDSPGLPGEGAHHQQRVLLLGARQHPVTADQLRLLGVQPGLTA